MITRTKLLSVIAATVLGVASAANAATLLEWNFNGVDSNSASSVVATANGNGLTGTITRGPGLALGADRSNAFGGIGFDSSSPASAFANGEYFLFTITADTGVTFSIDALSLNLARSDANGAAQAYLQYSLDGTNYFDAKAWSSVMGSGVPSASKSFTTLSMIPKNLSQISLRIAIYGNNNTTLPSDATYYFANSNGGATPMTLTGSVVPEPSTVALLALGIAGGVFVFRRRK